MAAPPLFLSLRDISPYGVPSSGASRHLLPMKKAFDVAAPPHIISLRDISHPRPIIRPFGALATVHRKVASDKEGLRCSDFGAVHYRQQKGDCLSKAISFSLSKRLAANLGEHACHLCFELTDFLRLCRILRAERIHFLHQLRIGCILRQFCAALPNLERQSRIQH